MPWVGAFSENCVLQNCVASFMSRVQIESDAPGDGDEGGAAGGLGGLLRLLLRRGRGLHPGAGQQQPPGPGHPPHHHADAHRGGHLHHQHRHGLQGEPVKTHFIYSTITSSMLKISFSYSLFKIWYTLPLKDQ